MFRQPYAEQMSPEIAEQLVEVGGSVLVLNFPPGAFFGVDNQVFTTGPRFKGMKLLPPGPHFISYRAAHLNEASFTTGFFIFILPKKVFVYKWDVETERLVLEKDEDTVARYTEGVQRFDFDAHQAPYDLGAGRSWVRLTQHITPAVLDRISPVSGDISIIAEGTDSCLDEPITEAEKALARQLKISEPKESEEEAVSATRPTAMEVEEAPASAGTSGRCFYTQIPRLVKSAGASAAQLTAWNLDKSGLFEQIVQTEYEGKADLVLGELQFAFVAFLFGQSLDGFTQWKALLGLLLGCGPAAVEQYPIFFTELLRTLRHQLSYLTDSSEESAHGGGSASSGLAMLGIEGTLAPTFLQPLMVSFFLMVHELDSQVQAEIFNEVQQLKILVLKQYGWNFDVQLISEDDEFAPVIVEDE